MICYWYIGQGGILLEIVGAGMVVFYAYKARVRVAQLHTDLDHIQEAVDSVLGEVRSQFLKQVVGFLLLAAGLIMQFVGNLGQRL